MGRERACFNSPEWGGGSSPVETEPLQIVFIIVVVCVFVCVVVCCCLLCVVAAADVVVAVVLDCALRRCMSTPMHAAVMCKQVKNP